jgi:hypothetical protein
MKLLKIVRAFALLSILGMLLAIPATRAVQAQATGYLAIAPKSAWAYSDTGANLGTAWRQPGYNDRGWKSGAGPLGFGDALIATKLAFGTTPKDKYITYYFRKTFTITDTQIINSLTLHALYDDGFAAYLNGTEIARANLDTPRALDAATLANKLHPARTYETFERSEALKLLVAGPNVLAVEVHQASKDSGKLAFDADLQLGLITDPPAFSHEPALAQLTDTSVQIQFASTVPTQARLEYGVAPSVDQSLDLATQTLTHEISLTGLQPATTYRYRVGIQTQVGQPIVWSQSLDFSTIDPQAMQVKGHMLIDPQGEWKYNDSGQNQGSAWRQPQFDDQGWAAGAAPLGYGYPDTHTELSFGSDPKNKYTTSYFRKTFVVTNTQAIQSLRLNIRYDDGFVAYINGAEVVRANMPITGTFPFNTFANGTHRARGYEFFDLTQAQRLLANGPNVLAIELHQATKISPDLLFDALLTSSLITDPPTFVTTPMLGQLTGTSAHIQVESDLPDIAQVEYGVAPQMDQHVTSQPGSTTHDLALTGLRPGTTYRYRVGLQRAPNQPPIWSSPANFTTDGGPGMPFRFAIWADSQLGSGAGPAQIFTRSIHDLSGREPFAFALALGDSVDLHSASDRDPNITSTVRTAFLGYDQAVSELAGSTALYNALGTSENPHCAACLNGYQRYLSNPEAHGERYYSFDYGDAHVVVLDSREIAGDQVGLSPEQQSWLRDDLAHSARRYKLVFIHDPLFHNQNGEVYAPAQKAALHQLFRSADVTAVFEGGSSYYDYVVEDGLPYVIVGSSGAQPAPNPSNASWGANDTVFVSVAPTEIAFQALRADGTVLDRHLFAAQPGAPAAIAPAAAQVAGTAAAVGPAVPIWLAGSLALILTLGFGALLTVRRARRYM